MTETNCDDVNTFRKREREGNKKILEEKVKKKY